MSSNRNGVGQILYYIKKYGLNAVLGFGLGVGIVTISIMTFGKPGPSSLEARSGDISERVNSINQNNSENRETNRTQLTSEMEEVSQIDSDQVGVPLKEQFTILLIGVDKRPEEESISNTDSLIVASIDQKNKKLILLSIPRDTQVILPNKNKEKINALARLGKGVSSTKEYVEKLIGTPIEGYVLTSFQGFKNIIDSLGGITINVEKNMFYDTGDNQDRYINLKKGNQRLNGTQALQYARFRNDELADISRAGRQQEILKAIVTEATEPRNLPKLPFLIPKVYQSIETDLNISQLWSLTLVVKNRDKYDVVNQTLPGKFSIEEGISYWKVNPKDAKQILGKLLKGEKPPVFRFSNPLTNEQNNKDRTTEVKREGVDSMKSENQGITFEIMSP